MACQNLEQGVSDRLLEPVVDDALDRDALAERAGSSEHVVEHVGGVVTEAWHREHGAGAEQALMKEWPERLPRGLPQEHVVVRARACQSPSSGVSSRPRSTMSKR